MVTAMPPNELPKPSSLTVSFPMPSRPTVLFLRSNPIAPDPRVEKEARALASAGYIVRALGWDRTAQLPAIENQDDFEIVRLPIQAGFGRGIGNLPQLLRWQWGLWRYLASQRGKYDALHACDFDTILPALFAGFFWKKPVVYDIFDFYAEHLRRTPNWIKHTIRRVDLWAVSQARAVILADDSRRGQIRGSSPRRVEVIYNSPEDAGKNLIPENDVYPTASQLRLAYIGLLQIERGLIEMLDVLQKHPEWHLVMAGFGGDQEQLLSLALGLPNVTFLGRISYERALRVSAASDALFATYDPAIPNHRYSSPNKVFEAMMLGKPIVVAHGTNMDRIIEENECGLVIEYGKADELETSLARLANDPALRHGLGKNARNAYENIYSWQLMQRHLLDLYQGIFPLSHA